MYYFIFVNRLPYFQVGRASLLALFSLLFVASLVFLSFCFFFMYIFIIFCAWQDLICCFFTNKVGCSRACFIFCLYCFKISFFLICEYTFRNNVLSFKCTVSDVYYLGLTFFPVRLKSRVEEYVKSVVYIFYCDYVF